MAVKKKNGKYMMRMHIIWEEKYMLLIPPEAGRSLFIFSF